MASLRVKAAPVPLPILVLLLLAAPSRGAEECGETKDGAEKGILRPPRPLASTGEPAPAVNSALTLIVDGRVSEITRDCVHCLDAALAGETVQVHFVSSPVSNDSSALPSPDPGSFQLRYRSFNPSQCERPRPPSQGFVVGRDWRLGREILFSCNPPLDPVGGSASARCEPGEDGVPRWSQAAPRCAPTDCRRGAVKRVAGAGAIASPGYTEKRLPANRRCQWDIRAEPGFQVWATFTQLRLPHPSPSSGEGGPQLYLFDGDEATPLANMSGVHLKPPHAGGGAAAPLNVTTVSNRLLVVLLTGPQPVDDALLYMDYAARPTACPDPGRPENGELVAYSLAVGSRVAFRCDRGHVMIGEPGAECLPSGEWSARPPRCDLDEPRGTGEKHQDVSQDVHVDTSAHDDLLVALGGPRGFTVAPASTETTTTSSTAAPFTVPASAAVTTAVSSEPTQPAPFVPTKPPSSSPSKTKAPPAPPKALPAIPTRPSTSQPAASPSSSEEALDPLPQDSKQDRPAASGVFPSKSTRPSVPPETTHWDTPSPVPRSKWVNRRPSIDPRPPLSFASVLAGQSMVAKDERATSCVRATVRGAKKARCLNIALRTIQAPSCGEVIDGPRWSEVFLGTFPGCRTH
ncbi:hypothetical protein HPB48_015750 [Haemaphysalis longicornis]|uniref:Uncharacterized protein n=1 Tax=Haemaphysalis longicornis TaxID=44386 RepID=A0A9J6H5B3_HAELO|nr:hypothetical protein HPB48_015750 [Haemaphysalis longicornis]